MKRIVLSAVLVVATVLAMMTPAQADPVELWLS